MSFSRFMQTARIIKSPSIRGTINYLNLEYTQDNKLELKCHDRVFELNDFTYSSIIDQNHIKMIKNNFNLDAISEVKNQLILKDEIDTEKTLLNHYETLSKNNLIPLSKRQAFLKKFFKNLEFPLYIQNALELQQKLNILLNHIAITSRISKGNFIIINSQLLSIIDDSPYFSFANKTLSSINTCYLAGEIRGVLIFVDSTKKWEDTEIIIGRETLENENGVYYIEGNKDFFENAEPSFNLRIVLRVAKTFICAENSHKNFTFSKIKIEKKPLWRRLLKV